MGKTCRYVVNAIGKGGETYYTQFNDKNELKKWVTEHQDKLLMNELKIVDKDKHPFLKLFSLKKV